MGLKRVFHRQPNPHTILYHSLYPTLYYCNLHSPTPTFPKRNRIKQSLRSPLQLRQNPLSPLLHNQRYFRPSPPLSYPNNTSTIFTRPLKRPRQLYPSQPTKHSTTHQARVVLPILICNPTICP
uniref:Uncharacterized protein n=1 Tax=Piliocolobus tephrosceles TaxID=591936 RepID=A0A8C9HV83_9PRIM